MKPEDSAATPSAVGAGPAAVSGGARTLSYLDEGSMPLPFCPGCGHAKVTTALDEALQMVGRPRERVVVVTDIGCVGLTDRHFNTNAFHGLHGRSITYASGIKLADPDLTVLVVMGDGGAGIGGAHLLAAARRNIGICVVVANNFNYGMTGGQLSCTTPTGALTATCHLGNLEAPLDLMGTLRPSKPAFLARTSVFADDLPALIARGLSADGFALLDVWDLCVAYYAGQNKLTRGTIDDMMADLEMPAGVHHEGTRPEFARAWRDLYHPDEIADEEGMCLLPPDAGLTPVAESPLQTRMGILIAGAAGQKIRSLATILGAGAIMSGLHATQKDDYPITVMTGHSAAEVILSPEPVVYTGIESPEVVLILSAEGRSRVARTLAALSPESRVYVEASLGAVDTPARVIPLDLKGAAKEVHRLAVGAVGVGAILAAEGIYPPEAFEAAARRMQKEKVADTNIAGLRAGAALSPPADVRRL
ncbi:MAG: thiamine pyrophosphate-dependent enzyme [Thermoleophilia bacterium]